MNVRQTFCNVCCMLNPLDNGNLVYREIPDTIQDRWIFSSGKGLGSQAGNRGRNPEQRGRADDPEAEEGGEIRAVASSR